MALDLVTISAVAILRVGSGIQGVGCPVKVGCEFTESDLDNIVSAHAETSDALFVPLKLGHTVADGDPASGWVEGVRRVGDRLYADLVGVPATVIELIRAKVYRTRSVELRRDFPVGGRRYPLVLVGVALLGAHPPAVDGLGDIIFSHRHHDCACPDPLALTTEERDIAFQMGISTEAILAQKRRDRADEIEGERQAMKFHQLFNERR